MIGLLKNKSQYYTEKYFFLAREMVWSTEEFFLFTQELIHFTQEILPVLPKKLQTSYSRNFSVPSHFRGPSKPNDFTVMILVWLLRPRINYLARFKYDWGYTTVIPSKCKAKQCLRDIRSGSFVLPCPEEGSENMRFIVNVASPHRASSQRHHQQIICPYIPLIILVYSTALCGASTSVSFVLSEFTCVLCVSVVVKRARCFLKSTNLIVSSGNITRLGSVTIL